MKPSAAPSSSKELIIPSILSFAPTDPTCGTGLHADVLTAAALGVMPLAVTTGVMVQNTSMYEGFLPVDDDWIVDQARAVLEDMPVHAIKVGTLGSAEAAAAVAEILADYPDIPVVYDPAFIPTGADPMAEEDFFATIGGMILPLADIVTPSLAEARRLVQDEDEEDTLNATDCAQRLLELECGHVLISGRHEQAAQIVNTLHSAQGILRTDVWERLPGTFHGAGSTLSAALAAFMAKGHKVFEAAYLAQQYTWNTLAQGARPGMGKSLPKRFLESRS